MTRRARLSIAIGAIVIAGLTAGCGSDTESSGDSPKLTVRHKLDRSCVPVGEKVTVAATTDPNVEIAFVPLYSDLKFHGEPTKGFTDKKGVFKRSLTIPGDAPPGPVDLKIIAAKGRKSANLGLNFTVVAQGEPCP